MDYRAYFYDSADVLTTFIDKSQPELEKIKQLVIDTLMAGNTIFHAGNG